MELNIYLVIFTFIVIIVIIYLVDSITTAVLIVSLLANFLIICIHLSSIELPRINIKLANAKSPAPVETSPETAPPGSETEKLAADRHMLGPEYDQYHVNHVTYTTGYDQPQYVYGTTATEAIEGVDAANTIIAQRRARDKKCMDGHWSKTADYYKFHFAEELNEAEAKRWWGNYDW